MNLQLLIPLLITAIVTIFGWYMVHLLASRRDRKNKQRELRISYLIEAWRKLEYATERKDVDFIEYLEKPIADIQLFGTKKQVNLAMKIVNEIINNKASNLIELLTELRKDLRLELNLEKLDSEIKVFRMNVKNNSNKNSLQ